MGVNSETLPGVKLVLPLDVGELSGRLSLTDGKKSGPS